MQSQLVQPSPTRTQPCPILILGVGNILLRDEGVGVRVVEALARMTLPPDVEVFDGATAGLDLLDVLADRRKVIIIDAIAGDSAPGTVLRLSPEDLLPRNDHSLSLHDVGLLETLTIARQLGIAPQGVIVIGVKPKDVSCGLTLSPEIERLVPQIIEGVLLDLNHDLGADALKHPPKREDEP